MLFSLAVVGTTLLFLAGCCSAQPNPFHGPCAQSIPQLAASGNLNYFAPVISNQLGNQGVCENDVGRFCPLSLAMVCLGTDQKPYVLPGAISTGCNLFPVYGACMPTDRSVCPTSLMNAQLDDYLVNYTSFQIGYGPLSGCAVPGMIPAICPGGAPPFASMSALCLDDLPRFQDDPAAVGVFVAIVVMCSICGVATVIVFIERIREWWINAVADELAAATSDEGTASHALNESIPLFRQAGPPNEQGGTAIPFISTSSSAVATAAKNDSLHYHHATAAQPSHWVPLPLLAYAKWFDLLSNLDNLLQVKERNFSNINTLFFEGLRVISMLFVIYGHTYFWPLASTGYSNNASAIRFFKSYESIGLFPAELAVDNFFFLSGFLFMHLYMKQIEKRHAAKMASVGRGGGAGTRQSLNESVGSNLESTSSACHFAEPLSIPETLLMYLRRWLRITPVAMMVLFTAEYLLQYLPRGTMNQVYRNAPVYRSCADNWWKQMLYIANYYDADGCVGWFWYLNCDFQLFIFGGILAWVYYRSQRYSQWLWWLLMLVSMAVTVSYAAHDEPFTKAGAYYGRTYTRAAPYLYGIITAVLVRSDEARKLVRLMRRRFIIYFFSLALLVSCINIMWYNDPVESRTTAHYRQFLAIYIPLAWGLGWLLVCLPWCTGHGGIFCRFLSHPIFIVLSKLTFCAYVLHLAIMTVDVGNQPMPLLFSVQTYLMRFGGYLVWTFISAIILHLVVELPFANINDALTRR